MNFSNTIPVTIILALSCFILDECKKHTNKENFLQEVNRIALPVKEPSDVCVAADSNSLWVVGDEGEVSLLKLDGTEIFQKNYALRDFEGVFARDSILYLIEERLCEVRILKAKTLEPISIHKYKCGGANNEGFEGATIVNDKYMLLVKEKNPVRIYKINLADMQLADQWDLPQFSDISAMTWHDGHLWLTSDEQRSVFKMADDMKTTAESWRVKIRQPEGMTFLPDGKLMVVSDYSAMAYIYDLSSQKKPVEQQDTIHSEQ